MELSRSSCRLCLSESEFNVCLFGSFCRKTNMLDKIHVCLNLVIEEADYLNTICYKCADRIDTFYDYTTSVKKCQTKLNSNRENNLRQRNFKSSIPSPINMHHVSSYVREQVYDADYTFSFLDMSNIEEKKEANTSSPYFSYFSPPNVVLKQSNEPTTWKTSQSRSTGGPNAKIKRDDFKAQCKSTKPRQLSRDLFESQSQDADDQDPRSLDWKLIPDSNIIKMVKQKCFGRSEF